MVPNEPVVRAAGVVVTVLTVLTVGVVNGVVVGVLAVETVGVVPVVVTGVLTVDSDAVVNGVGAVVVSAENTNTIIIIHCIIFVGDEFHLHFRTVTFRR